MKTGIDPELIQSCKKGNHTSPEKLFYLCKDSVYNVAFRFTGNREDAEDLTQEAFVKIYLSLKDFRMESSFSTWVYPITANLCTDLWWRAVKRGEGFRVSRAGKLVGIHPGKTGLHLEVYPVVLTRYENPSVSLQAGFDLAWYPTPASGLRLTVKPDFAQVEADPYQVNLSKYELYLDERRPFFTEAAEMFKPPGGFELFYSRRIGKRLPGW
ncbi:MAG: hypothetical protein B1H40_01100 [Candidatus Latescibacteria bacterium 4484_181]|nr:MAG: hypothetical protein B1H40_01100 [Candidatus Latescibacteria bacterium 4484_181]RKY72636.1 MAG: hypothetical protein DRQ24_04615 [Candidatus Latescibacterota bacterium]HDN67851.1 sigma-70 family RNA polymerase sigma factor [Bacillota bacterium]